MTLTSDPDTGLLRGEFVQVDEVRVRHLVAGEGKPVVLLHGFGRSLDDWAGNIAALAERHRVYALDMLGFGLSDKPDVPTRFDSRIYSVNLFN